MPQGAGVRVNTYDAESFEWALEAAKRDGFVVTDEQETVIGSLVRCKMTAMAQGCRQLDVLLFLDA
jgi:hypothetical protein